MKFFQVQIVGVDLVSRAEGGGALYGVFEFADVAGPGVVF